MPWPWLWEWRLGSQPAGTASAAFSFLEPGTHHTKKTLSSLWKVATLCGKIKLLDDIPFKFTMAHIGNSIQYFLPATCNQGSQTACFVSGFWVWLGMKGRFIFFYYYYLLFLSNKIKPTIAKPKTNESTTISWREKPGEGQSWGKESLSIWTDIHCYVKVHAKIPVGKSAVRAKGSANSFGKKDSSSSTESILPL